MSDERQRMEQLCKQIQTENDQKRFSDLVNELNELLSKKPNRLAEQRQQG